MSSSSADRIFNGVRFVLFGFDSVSEAQYRAELTRRGGIDVGKYDASCTHVIVSGRLYDDPVCVAAREDGKILVTELWIDDSVDFGALADASRVLYRPVKDLNGIPGSETFYICLTGYQRQEREDIMKMVSLMGARFSKPLIANQVTHLICYKFEGEKYELAKKVKIKLVNHRWLEDCLKAWEILPIDNYTKSGWELEVLEAEAKDSEEETEDPGTELLGRRSSGVPSHAQGETSAGANCHVYTPNKMSTRHLEASAANPSHPAESLLANQKFSTPHKETCFEEASYKQNPESRADICHQESGSIVPISGYQNLNSIRNAESLFLPDGELQRKSSAFSGDVSTAKIDPTLSRLGERSSTLCYSMRTPEKKSTRDEPPTSRREDLNENISNCDLDIRTESRTDYNPNYLQSSTSRSALPQKRKVLDLSTGSKSPKLEGKDSKYSPQSASTNMGSAQQKPTSAMSINYSHAAANGPSEGAEINSKDNQHAALSKFSLSYRRSLKREQPTSEAKISKSADSLSIGSAQSGQSKEALDQLLGITSMSNERKASGHVISPSDDMVLGDFPPDVEPREAVNVSGSCKKTASGLDSLVVDDGCRDLQSLKAKAFQSFGGLVEPESVKSGNNGDIVTEDAFKFIANGTGQTQGRQQGRGATSPHSRDSETRKLSSTASTSMCTENTPKESSAVRMKKVASRRNLNPPKPTTGMTNKDKGIDTSGRATTPRKAEAKSANIAKSDARMAPEKAADIEKKEMGNVVPKDAVMENKAVSKQHPFSESSNKKKAVDQMNVSVDPEKENKPKENGFINLNVDSHPRSKFLCEDSKHSKQTPKKVVAAKAKNSGDQASSCAKLVNGEPVWFILSGHRFQRKEFQSVIRRLKGRVCRDSHNWSYQATHFIVPDPVRRTEKFFAAAAAGRWILKTDYLTASNEAGKFLDEEPYEWHKKGLTEDGAINLEAPRKWRRIREKTGHGAFYGMRIIIYGECIAPPLDTLKRVVKAGDGTILATSPPYTRFLKSGVHFAIVSSSMPRVDSWVQEFLRHEVPCVLADYLVEYVCKPGYSLERHVLYNTHSWAEKSFANLLSRSEEVVTDDSVPSDANNDDISCSVCGLCDRGEVMLICGDESGSIGCGIGAHIDCCDPPLDVVPEGDWFCPKCSEERAPRTPIRNSKRKSSSNCK